MTADKTDHPAPRPRERRRGSEPDLPSQDLASSDIDPATAVTEEDDEPRLPEMAEETTESVAEGPLAIGHAAI